jgi:hypothetical protein
MDTILEASASTRPKRRRAIVAAALLVLAGCGGSEASTAGSATGRADRPAAEADRSSQPLEAVVTDYLAPVDGAAATEMMRVRLWVDEERQATCGGQGSFAAAGDRFDQSLFPDFDLIARDGLGLARPVQEPTGEAVPVDEGCLERTLSELADVDKAFGEWMDTVVYPTWSSAEVAASAQDSTGCLRQAMGWGDDQVETLDSFIGEVDGAVTGLGSGGPDEFESKVAALDRQASEALTTCAQDTYDLFSAKLEAQRGAFLDRHNETVAAAAAALERAGYTP